METTEAEIAGGVEVGAAAAAQEEEEEEEKVGDEAGALGILSVDHPTHSEETAHIVTSNPTTHINSTLHLHPALRPTST